MADDGDVLPEVQVVQLVLANILIALELYFLRPLQLSNGSIALAVLMVTIDCLRRNRNGDKYLDDFGSHPALACFRSRTAAALVRIEPSRDKFAAALPQIARMFLLIFTVGCLSDIARADSTGVSHTGLAIGAYRVTAGIRS